MNPLDELRQDKRHLWLLDAADQVRRWRAEDEANGQPWEPPYGPMCADPELCRGKGYCPRDPTCGD